MNEKDKKELEIFLAEYDCVVEEYGKGYIKVKRTGLLDAMKLYEIQTCRTLFGVNAVFVYTDEVKSTGRGFMQHIPATRGDYMRFGFSGMYFIADNLLQKFGGYVCSMGITSWGGYIDYINNPEMTVDEVWAEIQAEVSKHLVADDSTSKEELVKKLKEYGAELVYEDGHLLNIRVNGYVDHSRMAYICCDCEKYAPKKVVLVIPEECGSDKDDFKVALKNNTGNAVPECVARKFGGSILLNQYWYGYAKGYSNCWQGLNEGVTPEQVLEYLKGFWGK